ncbi:PACE efflux transporter [Ideonella azotifigens]|uniref:PACE efflux transporter n=1 Tax=Ideonella azotifigens TaxID=513160 RepID=UPI001143DB13|nr:PACE efflux transporter [Ideonella azotifigens]MCD2339284.1 PACE efflux transporter [Ideonella azotifigens]
MNGPGLQGLRRRVLYVTLFEVGAIAANSLIMQALGHPLPAAGAVAVAASVAAVLWNMVFNALFERWEARQTTRGRSFARRAAHAVLFEGGLTLLLVPVMMLLLQISFWHAVSLEVGLIAFFLVYTYLMNWAFDAVFGLPASAA